MPKKPVRRPAKLKSRKYISKPQLSFMSPREVCELTSLSSVTIWRLKKKNLFPASWKISPGRVGFLRNEIEDWMKERAKVPSPHFS